MEYTYAIAQHIQRAINTTSERERERRQSHVKLKKKADRVNCMVLCTQSMVIMMQSSIPIRLYVHSAMPISVFRLICLQQTANQYLLFISSLRTMLCLLSNHQWTHSFFKVLLQTVILQSHHSSFPSTELIIFPFPVLLLSDHLRIRNLSSISYRLITFAQQNCIHCLYTSPAKSV